MTILKLNLTRLTEKASRGSDSDLNSNYPRPDLFLSRNDPWWSLLWSWLCWQNTRPHKSDNYYDDESENSLIEGWWQLRGDLNLNWLLPAWVPALAPGNPPNPPKTQHKSHPQPNPWRKKSRWRSFCLYSILFSIKSVKIGKTSVQRVASLARQLKRN